MSSISVLDFTAASTPSDGNVRCYTFEPGTTIASPANSLSLPDTNKGGFRQGRVAGHEADGMDVKGAEEQPLLAPALAGNPRIEGDAELKTD